MTCRAQPRPNGAGISSGSTEKAGWLVAEHRGDRILIVGGRAVVGVVLRRRSREIISEPDDAGGPQQGPPAVLENGTGAHRNHGRYFGAGAFKIAFPRPRA